MTNIDDIINGIDTLKPIPPVATQLMTLAEDEHSSMSDIADLIIHDPSITASILKICNSAHFGLSRRIDSVRDAIVLLGLDEVVELVLLNATAANFRDEPDGYGLGEGELWKHAVFFRICSQGAIRNPWICISETSHFHSSASERYRKTDYRPICGLFL